MNIPLGSVPAGSQELAESTEHNLRGLGGFL
jgi:hypothetical protein